MQTFLGEQFDEHISGGNIVTAEWLHKVKIAAAEQADVALAIENGIVRALGGDEEVWVDLAVVVMRDVATGAEASSAASVGAWGIVRRAMQTRHEAPCE